MIKEYYIGLLSGTSIDCIDSALFEIADNSIKLVSAIEHHISQKLKDDLNSLIVTKNTSLEKLGILGTALGHEFANAVLNLLKTSSLDKSAIQAIGFHGQTIYHHPEPPYMFTMQLGCPATLVELTKIPVITDFRQRDIVHNGQGAPLAPLFHQKFFSDNSKNRAVINIGGITNISLLLKDNHRHTIASDLGPGNTLLDLWFRKHHPLSPHDYDLDGNFAKGGRLNVNLLSDLLEDQYFTKSWPKSTGREYFNLSWLDNKLKSYPDLKPCDVQRTLIELTTLLISDCITKLDYKINEIFLCGGGAYNKFLVKRLQELLDNTSIELTDKLGISANWVEAGLFAWLAYCSWHKQQHNLSQITGSNTTSSSLGCIYY